MDLNTKIWKMDLNIKTYTWLTSLLDNDISVSSVDANMLVTILQW